MLINVFGQWINPDNISYLDVARERGIEKDEQGEFIYRDVGTRVIFNSMAGAGGDCNANVCDQDIYIDNKTPDEIAEEINRKWQINLWKKN